MSLCLRVLLLSLLPLAAVAQTSPETWSPPPLVEAQPDAPAAESAPATAVPPAPTELRPGRVGLVPAQGEPPPEIGLMVTEVAFGALTAAGTALIPYYLLLKPLSLTLGAGVDSGVTSLIFILLFSAVPLAVSQTELSLAAGSRFYESESWPPALFGLLAQASVLGLYYLLGAGATGNAELALMVGTLGFVPIAEMMAINLTKTLRQSPAPPLRALVRYSPEEGLVASVAAPVPLFAPADGSLMGVHLPVLAGRF